MQQTRNGSLKTVAVVLEGSGLLTTLGEKGLSECLHSLIDSAAPQVSPLTCQQNLPALTSVLY